MTYYSTKVLRVGPEAKSLLDGGVLILFAEPVPPALEELSVIHQPEAPLAEPIRVGDVIESDGITLTVTAVGDIAADNLTQLGHVVIYANDATATKLLPGAVHARGSVTLPAADAVIRLRHAQ